ncbi:MAG: hypothetical protein GY804_02180 [Alphaproteobacteria bacterium]|nr:hypothetical protein [Alphaproteobacteria bacterium]
MSNKVKILSLLASLVFAVILIMTFGKRETGISKFSIIRSASQNIPTQEKVSMVAEEGANNKSHSPRSKALQKPDDAFNPPQIRSRNGDWMTQFYIYENIDGVIAEIKDFDKQGFFKDTDNSNNISQILTNIITFHPEHIDKLTETEGLSRKGKEAIIIAIARSGETLKAAQTAKKWGWSDNNIKMIQSLRKQDPRQFLKGLSITLPSQLDFMWYAFFASADERYIHKIIKSVENKKYNIIIGGAAEWSLASNIKQHEMVRRIAIKESTNQDWSEELRQKLKGMVKVEKPNFTVTNGLFGAKLAVISPSYSKDWEGLPATSGVKIEEKKELNKGETAEITIFFGGMELAEDLSADITYDIKITKPDGSIASEDKALNALKVKVPTSFSVFRPTVKIEYRYDETDIPGVYKIDATLHDNISGKSLQLEEKLTLLKENL